MTIKSPSRRARDYCVATACGAFVALMVGASYAAVPLYDWFCRTTGFGGKTQIAITRPTQTLERMINVRFDANVSGGLPWRFEPERPAIDIKLGEVVTVLYTVTNRSAREITGVASYNVSPLTTGIHFQKINCFCFEEQTLKPGERRDMEVVFYVDPSLATDDENRHVNSITLSYTMHAARPQEKPVTVGRANSDGKS